MGDSGFGPSGLGGASVQPPKEVSSEPYTILMSNMTTTETAAEEFNVKMCDVIDTDYNVVMCVISAICFLFGILYTFCGKYTRLKSN